MALQHARLTRSLLEVPHPRRSIGRSGQHMPPIRAERPQPTPSRVWPCSTRGLARSPSRSHTRAVASAEAVSTCRPSGLNDRRQHRAGVALQHARIGLVVLEVPHPRRGIVRSGQHMPPVRAEDRRHHQVAVALQHARIGQVVLEVPHPRRSIGRSGQHMPPIRAEDRRHHQVGVALQHARIGLVVLEIPHPRRSIVRSGQHMPPVRAEDRRPHRVAVAPAARADWPVVSRSHTRAVASAEAVSTCRSPSRSHTRAVASAEAVSTCRPSGLKTADTRCRCGPAARVDWPGRPRDPTPAPWHPPKRSAPAARSG